MKLETFTYQVGKGWSLSEFPRLDSKRTVVFVFGSSEFLDTPACIDELRAKFPLSLFVGCSSAGEIHDTQVRDHSLSVAVMQLEHTDVKSVCLPINSAENSFETGQTLAKKLEGSQLCGITIFSDGLHVNGSALVAGVNSSLSKEVIVTGGLAGDGARFKETWILKDAKPQTGFVSALGYYGSRFKIGHGSQGGWDIFGVERVVTKAKNNVLYELDGRPALDLYKEYLGEKSSELPASALLFPLQIRTNKNDSAALVRTVLAVDETTKSMTFAGDIPTGSLAQLMRANFDRLIDGASLAASRVSTNVGNQENPLLAIAISCVGRRLVLGERIEEEVEATLSKLPRGTKQVGFYSYGEISPYVAEGSCELHNQTMTLTTLYEE